MNGDARPLVSCVMPTAGRRRWVPQAIRYFLRQDYPNRELVIVDDGEDAVEDLVPDDPRIRYKHFSGSRTLGAKRNLCVAESRGDLILHWDDDDWFAPRRISAQVDALLCSGGEICGLTRMLFHELSTGRTWLYEYQHDGRGPCRWLAGGSLLYTKDFWSRAPFPDVQVASDTSFVWSQSLQGAVVLRDHEIYVAMIHRRNTSPKLLHEQNWHAWQGDLRQIVGEDAGFYEEARERARASAARARAVRVGYVVRRFSPLPETTVRREVLALCNLGHEVVVYTPHGDRDPRVTVNGHAGLTVREIDCTASLAPLVEAVLADRVEHLHGSLMLWAQSAARHAAEAAGIPFTIGVSGGISLFTEGNPETYGALAASPSCAGVVVEDEFVRQWLAAHCGVPEAATIVISPLLDLARYRRNAPRPETGPVRILAVGRFIERKGLLLLVEAFQRLSRHRRDAELWLAGGGPEEAHLREAAEGNPSIIFLGFLSERECRKVYEQADVFCLPCVQLPNGDADGTPTALLEAMAFELPIVTSDLLSLPSYVRDGEEGLLAPPGDVAAIADRLERLCADGELRRTMGRRARARVEELGDLVANAARWSALFEQSRGEASRHSPRVLEEEPREVPGLIDVVVPHYECAEYLGACLESVAAQSYNFVRLTVVDDGSRDPGRARTVAGGVTGRLPVRFLEHGTNRGAPAARNTGAADTDGEYLFFLDADCVLDPDAFRKLLETLLGDPSAAWAYCGFVWGGRAMPGEPFDAAALRSRNYISTMSLIRRSAFPGFDESLRRLQDWDLWITMTGRGHRGVWCNETLFATPMRPHSISSGSCSWEEAAAVLKRKHRL